NLQNIPRETHFRSLFTAPDNCILVTADLNQMELRVAALVTNDPVMLKAYAEGKDLHRETAAAIAGVSVAEITTEQRQTAKAVNFGLLFGMGPRRLAQYAESDYGVQMPEAEAKKARDKFFSTYRGVASWQKRAAAQAKLTGRSETPGGRIRDFRKEGL